MTTEELNELNELDKRFDAFYRAVNGCSPYEWQRRLVREVAEDGRWPDVIDGPTGSGKSVVIDAGVFLNAYAGELGVSPDMPRRLVVAVNRRSLVDSQYLHARDVADKLRRALRGEATGDGEAPDPVMVEVAEGLVARWGASGQGVAREMGPLIVTLMRGGVDAAHPDVSWRMFPEAPMVICATPDMVGSRLLFRGYGVSQGMRPVEAGLLACDCALVVDEAHLNRQLVKTARRIADLERMPAVCNDDKGMAGSGVPVRPVARPLQVVESTATPSRSGGEDMWRVDVSEDDVAGDEELRRRIARPKRIVTHEMSGGKSYPDDLANAALDLSRQRGGVTAVIANTVAVAASVATALRRREEKVTCVLGRMRPYDRADAVDELRRLAESDGTGFIVGTQALEVGLNYDCRSMVTEICPASALAQRLGRVNRFGRSDEGVVLVIDGGAVSRGPYDEADLAAARAWLRDLDASHPSGVSAFDLANVAVPDMRSRRPLFQRLEYGDLAGLVNTSERLGAEDGVQTVGADRADVALWLRDDLEPEASHDVSLAVRAGLPQATVAACDLLARIPPVESELFPCSYAQLRGVMRACGCVKVDGAKGGQVAEPRTIFASADGQQFHAMAPDERLVPGGVYVIPADVEAFIGGIVVAPPKTSLELSTSTDVHDEIALGAGLGKVPFVLGDRAVGSICAGDVAIEGRVRSLVSSLREELADLAREDDGDRTIDDVMDGFVTRVDAELPEGCAARWVLENLEAIVSDDPSEDIGGEAADRDDADRDGDADVTGVAVTLVFRPDINDGGVSRTEIGGMNEITLNEHQSDVATLAGDIARSVGLPAAYADALSVAGAHHDDGKADLRFQRMLAGGRKPVRTLAKGKARSRADVLRLYRALGLDGWRHEQLSAARVWGLSEGALDERASASEHDRLDAATARLLVTRLVGTSHGRGRASFDRGPEGLCVTGGETCDEGRVKAAINELFGDGVWESVIASTDRAFGYWGCAYLEAILRAADARVSAREQGEGQGEHR